METESHQSTSDKQLSLFFIPFYTTSHIIPIVDTARLIAAHAGGGVVVVHIITTHQNALLFENTVNRDNQNGSQIIIHKLQFPSKEVGLPEGIENLNSATNFEISSKVYMGIMLLRKPMEQMIRDCRPDCIISDMFFPWTVDLAEELGIPRIHFYPSGYFPRSCIHSLKTYAPHENADFETQSFEIPGLPDPIQMKRSQLAAELKMKTKYGALEEQVEEAERRSYGTIMDSFLDLEPNYIQYFKKVNGKRRLWNIAPMSLFCSKSLVNGDTNSGINRDEYDFFGWLDSQAPKSVLYVCFGSTVRFSTEQLKEIASALEDSGSPFLWVCRPPKAKGKGQNNSEILGKEEEWLPEGFEERIRKRNIGFLVKGWAPQLMILNHPSIAGFMNHAGWSSFLEAVTAGMPLITWPLFAEQFYAERFVVDVLKIGIEVGVDYWNSSFFIDAPIVSKKKIEKAVRRFMSGSNEISEMRKKANELKLKAIEAVEEGGSSYNDVMAFISEIKSISNQKFTT